MGFESALGLRRKLKKIRHSETKDAKKIKRTLLKLKIVKDKIQENYAMMLNLIKYQMMSCLPVTHKIKISRS